MKRTLFTVMIALAVLTGAYSIAGAADGPHRDYRPDASGDIGYYSTTCSGAACHTLTKVTFLPGTLDTTAAPNEKDFTSLCLACHNAAGEAHNKSAGSPSNNVYINGTGLVPGTAGDSHSWNGKNHNAGTRTPTSAGFIKTVNGSDFMVSSSIAPYGRKVRCQTCHDAMTKAGKENFENWYPVYNLSGTTYQANFAQSSTKQYLARYIKVYRNNVAMAAPTNTRTKNQYLVDPSEYTYDYSNATITFKTSQGSNVIYAEIPEPYLRVDNTANAICLDCHIDRISGSVSHPPGAGAKNGHPAKVNYGHTLGLQDTLKPAGTGNVYFENVSGYQKVLCTSCHDPHNSASKNGQIMREADDQTLCGDCHKTKLSGYSTAGSVNIHNGSKHTSPTYCLDCHTTHNSKNVLMIKNTINGKAINFQNFSGANSFGNDTGSSVCEACHTKTKFHRVLNNSTTLGHNTGKNCLQCHKHETGFQHGGSGSDCTSCHGQPPAAGSVPSGWNGDGDKHSVHMGYILKKFGLSGSNACACCHGSKPGSTHPESLRDAYIDFSSPTYWGGGTWSKNGTDGMDNTADDICTNVACHFRTPATRTWGGALATCESCHEFPGSVSNDWAANSNNGHVIRYMTAGKKGAPLTGYTTITSSATYNTNLNVTHLNVATAYNKATDTYEGVTSDVNKCGKCHPNTSSNHMDGYIELAPNGYGAGGGNFDITVGKVTGNTVQCSNVACHFTRKTPNWY